MRQKAACSRACHVMSNVLSIARASKLSTATLDVLVRERREGRGSFCSKEGRKKNTRWCCGSRKLPRNKLHGQTWLFEPRIRFPEGSYGWRPVCLTQDSPVSVGLAVWSTWASCNCPANALWGRPPRSFGNYRREIESLYIQLGDNYGRPSTSSIVQGRISRIRGAWLCLRPSASSGFLHTHTHTYRHRPCHNR